MMVMLDKMKKMRGSRVQSIEIDPLVGHAIEKDQWVMVKGEAYSRVHHDAYHILRKSTNEQREEYWKLKTE